MSDASSSSAADWDASSSSAAADRELSDSLDIDFLGDDSSSSVVIDGPEVTFTLTRYLGYYRSGGFELARIRFVISDAVGISNKLFVYQLTTQNPTLGTKEWKFSHICGPWELNSVPEDAAEETSGTKFFRLNYVDLALSNEILRQQFEELVRGDLAKLAYAVAGLANLTEGPNPLTITS